MLDCFTAIVLFDNFDLCQGLLYQINFQVLVLYCVLAYVKCINVVPSCMMQTCWRLISKMNLFRIAVWLTAVTAEGHPGLHCATLMILLWVCKDFTIACLASQYNSVSHMIYSVVWQSRFSSITPFNCTSALLERWCWLFSQIGNSLELQNSECWQDIDHWFVERSAPGHAFRWRMMRNNG